MNEALRRKDLHTTCLETARYFLSKEGVLKFLHDARMFFQKELLTSKNTYLLEFLEAKHQELLSKTDRVQRLGAIEIAVFLCTCDRPERSAEGRRVSNAKDAEDLLAQELKQFLDNKDFDPQTIEKCVRILTKHTREDFDTLSEKMWSVADRLTRERGHFQRLRKYWEMFDEKRQPKLASEVLVECFKTVYDAGAFFRDVRQYRPIVVQCMLKAEYLFESLGIVDCGERVYVTCLYHLPKLATQAPRNLYKEENQFEEKSRYVTLG